jgi:hypothetical protein
LISSRIPSSGFLLTAIADALGTIWSSYAKRSNRRIGNIDDTAKRGTICEFTMIEHAACQRSKHIKWCASVIALIWKQLGVCTPHLLKGRTLC